MKTNNHDATPTSREVRGFNSSEIEFLVEMARDVYGPTAWDDEVQFYLDQLYNQETK
jgi:hypothetical protein